mgnify:FL=1|jgi:hypothetical protein|tara:strand:+ start:439 stop:567 length:129 start_codon:yes stop_codon:yes gene_type:complete
MNCKHCNKKITEYINVKELKDKQCFACGSFLTDKEIEILKNK